MFVDENTSDVTVFQILEVVVSESDSEQALYDSSSCAHSSLEEMKRVVLQVNKWMVR